MEEKDHAAVRQGKEWQEAKELFAKQAFEFPALIQNLTNRIEHAEKPHGRILPSNGGDGDANLLTLGNEILAYHLMVSIPTSSQHQLTDKTKEKQLIEKETTNHHLHQEILVEIPKQTRMTIMMMTKMTVVAGAGDAVV